MTQVVPSCLDLFEGEDFQYSILGWHTVEYKPVSSIDSHSDLRFSIKGNGDRYLDLNEIFLNVKLRLINGSTRLPYTQSDENQPGVVNNILHSMFETINVFFNGRKITTSEYYGYRSYFEKLLNYGGDAARTHMFCDGWLLDNGDMGLTSPAYTSRKKWFDNDNMIELEGRLHVDVLNQHRFLINNVDVDIELSFAKPEFFIMERENVSGLLKIEDATLYVIHNDLDPSILVAHAKLLSLDEHIRMPYKRGEIKTFTIPANSTMFNNDNLIQGTIPNRLLAVMVDGNSFLGDRSKNPFIFHHYSMYSCSVFIDHQEYPLEFDFDTPKRKHCTRAYRQLYDVLGKHYADEGNQITMDMFIHGFFIMAWNLTRDRTAGGDYISPRREGNLRFQGKFKQPLQGAVTVITYAEYDSKMMVNKNREVILASS